MVEESKDMRIGIIGAENSHSIRISEIINVQKKIRGCSVDYIWGETGALARKAAKAGRIPNIAGTPKQMLGKIDALIVDHRHPKHHLNAALPFVVRGIPAFIDKPFCYRTAEGREFLKVARKHKTPVTSFSTLPLQQSFRRFVRKMAGLGDILGGVTYGSCDLKSRYGSVFFYGIHQVAMAVAAFGYDVSYVLVTDNGNGSTGQLIYSTGKIVTLNFIREGCRGFGIMALGSKASCYQVLTNDKSPYLRGVKMFTNMFRTGREPLKYVHILKPIQILEAMERSVKSGQKEKVRK